MKVLAPNESFVPISSDGRRSAATSYRKTPRQAKEQRLRPMAFHAGSLFLFMSSIATRCLSERPERLQLPHSVGSSNACQLHSEPPSNADSCSHPTGNKSGTGLMSCLPTQVPYKDGKANLLVSGCAFPTWRQEHSLGCTAIRIMIHCFQFPTTPSQALLQPSDNADHFLCRGILPIQTPRMAQDQQLEFTQTGTVSVCSCRQVCFEKFSFASSLCHSRSGESVLNLHCTTIGCFLCRHLKL